jgi:hypothetical protein
MVDAFAGVLRFGEVLIGKGEVTWNRKTWIDMFWRFEIVMEASIENEISYS